MTSQFVGIDFGTTNSAVAVASGKAPPRLLPIAGPDDGGGETWRSLLFFEPEESAGGRRVSAGAIAIRRYLDSGGEGRLVQSIKSHLASRLFSRTAIFGRTFTLEELIATYLRKLRGAVDVDLGRRAVVGRPVRYWGAQTEEDDRRAVSRMREALALAGFDEAVFEYEPIAAAAAYAARTDRDELLLVADFGGGTSDFTVVRVGPGVAPGDERAILATTGVGVGGDAFDARVIDALVAPMLGKGTSYRDELGATAPVPAWIFGRLRRWHLLSLLKEPRTSHLLERIETGALAPQKIRNLRRVVDDDLGLRLHRAVESTKVALSSRGDAPFRFGGAGVALAAQTTRDALNAWIAPDLAAIAHALDEALARAGVAAGDIDRVFATGGSSLLPALRSLLAARFGKGRVVGGGELTSVATGLAERARALACA